MKKEKMFLAVDQYGNKYVYSGRMRKGLLNFLKAKKAFKIYVDKLDGRSVHVGYGIGNRWFTCYELTPIEREGKEV